jgi:phage terminase small subunit
LRFAQENEETDPKHTFFLALTALKKPKQRAFVRYYLETLNASEAARTAGYSAKTARQIGSRLLTNVDILRVLELGFAAFSMSRWEVLWRLTLIARGDIGDFLAIDPLTGAARVDLERAREAGQLGLIRRLVLAPHGVSIELHNALDAIEMLGKYFGLFSGRMTVERAEVVQPIVFVNVGASPYKPDLEALGE